MKLITWNINGLRSIYKKNFDGFIKKHKPDILCLQETKIDAEKFHAIKEHPKNYDLLLSPAKRPGYSGVASFLKKGTPLNQNKIEYGINKKSFDNEGRFLVSDHQNFLLYNTYFPSGTSGDERQEFKYKFLDSFLEHIKSLPKAKKTKLIICGDFNICHKEIDIHHPEKAEKLELSGFLPEERAWMDKFLDAGFIDAFRYINGDIKSKYSWWSYRSGARKKNLGWRIDYIFVAEGLAKKVKSAKILDKVEGSDHCPVMVEMR